MVVEEDEFCKVCGRDENQVKDILGDDAGFVTHQNVLKCYKCYIEYVNQSDSGSDKPDAGSKDFDWKKEITA